jgi:hypothetical protein
MKIMLMSPAGLRPRKTALAMLGSNSKLQAYPFVREGAIKYQASNCHKHFMDKEKLVKDHDGSITPGQTGPLTIDRKTTFSLTFDEFF